MTPVSADLLRGLYTHAVADERWPQLGLRDPAAREWLSRLGMVAANPPVAERLQVVRSAWLDLRCQWFLRRYPGGICINWGAGLNTRFHRLSQWSDWPRFHWIDLDSPEVIKTRQASFPRLDNYTCLDDTNSLGDVLAQLPAQTPLLVVAEGVCGSMCREQWCAWQQALGRAAAHGGDCHLVFDYVTRLRILGRGSQGLRALYPALGFSGHGIDLQAPGIQLLDQTDFDTSARAWRLGQWRGLHLQYL